MTYQQVFQLALDAVGTCLGQALPSQYSKDESFMEKLFSIIYFDCGERRQMLEGTRILPLSPGFLFCICILSTFLCFSSLTGTQDILMFLKNDDTIREKKSVILGWIQNSPGDILKLAKKSNTAIPLPEYVADIEPLLLSKFRRSCRTHHNRSPERERVIVRYVVHMQLLMMDRSKSKKPGPLVAHRNPETPVEASIRVNNETRDAGSVPSPAVLQQLQTSSTFFDRNCRTTSNFTTPSRNAYSPPTRDSTFPVVSPPSHTDWTSTKVASMDLTRKYNHRLVIRLPHCDIQLHHHPVEVYIAWNLHETKHIYENLGPSSTGDSCIPIQHQGSSVFVVSDEGGTERYPQAFMVARPGSTIFDESFPPSTYQLPIGRLISFLICHGHSDPMRSNGWRLDISNGGQAQDTSSVEFRPKTLCGDKIFLSEPDGELVRMIIGKMVDGVCRAIKRMAREMGIPLSHNQKRFLGYADKLRIFLFAEVSFVENVTLQLLDISAGHTGVEHEDVSNDPRASYNSTCAKVMNLECEGRLMSLKIVCSFRKKIGDYYSVQMTKIERLLVNAQTMLEEVNASYSRLISHHKGSYFPSKNPTWDNIDSLFLDEYSPWVTKEIKTGATTIQQKTISTLTGVSRVLWMSTAVSAIYNLAASYDEHGMVQMMLIASWQNSFTRFWEVCKRMNKSQSKFPIYEYQRVARSLFHEDGGKDKGGEMLGGDDPRFGPHGFDFKAIFGTFDDPKKEKVTDVCNILLELLDAVNLLSSNKGDGENFGRDQIMELVGTYSAKIRAVAPCEMGAFRLMIFISFAATLRVRLDPRPKLRQIHFPVKGSGSWNHVKDVCVADSDVESVCREIQRELSTPWRRVCIDEVEVILCESKLGRLLQKYDTFVKGQSLFRLDSGGESWLKRHGEYVWRRYRVRHKLSSSAM